MEITNKKMVRVLKNHECFACNGEVKKGNEAVCVMGKLDGKHNRMILHLECNIRIVKECKGEYTKGVLNDPEALESYRIERLIENFNNEIDLPF